MLKAHLRRLVYNKEVQEIKYLDYQFKWLVLCNCIKVAGSNPPRRLVLLLKISM